MTPLILCIVSTTLLFVILKFFNRYRIENLQAITVNYVVAGTLGLLLSGQELPTTAAFGEAWFWGALGMGGFFIIMFSLLALSSQRVGVGITSVANKMSLVIPVVAGVLFFGETLHGMKLVGVVLALVSVTLAIWPQKEAQFDPKYLYLPVLIFFGSGSLDTFLNYMREYRMQQEHFAHFSSMLFFVAATFGMMAILYRKIRHRTEFERKSVIAGIALGIPNYFSIYLLLKALDLPGLESTQVFPIVNVGIVLFSTFLAFVIFKERPSRINLSGVALAALSIYLISQG
jgi:drug/metabolite transporter (DMT)-like permease